MKSRHQKRVVDFRSDWVLSWGRPMSRFTRAARSRVSSVTLIPKESPSLHYNQLFVIDVLIKVIHNSWWWTEIKKHHASSLVL